jgi:hypothetical protein
MNGRKHTVDDSITASGLSDRTTEEILENVPKIYFADEFELEQYLFDELQVRRIFFSRTGEVALAQNENKHNITH